MITSWISHGFDKNKKNVTPPENIAKDYELYLAKNESEGFHITFISNEDASGITLEISGSHEGVNNELFYETFVNVRGEYYPDPLVPYKDFVNVSKDVPLNIFVEFTADSNACAGDSVFMIAAKDSDGCIIDSYKIKLRVWDFTLPQTPSCETAVGLLYVHMLKFHKAETDEEKTALYKAYYDELLKHKMSAYTLPYELLDPRADEYMSDPRVTTFTCDQEIGTYNSIKDDEKLKKISEKVSSNPLWKHKVYSYPLDEPTTLEHLETLKNNSERLETLVPGVHKVSPFYKDIDVDENTDQIEFMGRYLDIWCPKACLFEEIYSDEQKEKYPPFYDRMMQYKESGSRIWWYVCNYPQPPYFNVFTNDIGLNSRALFWQQYRYEVPVSFIGAQTVGFQCRIRGKIRILSQTIFTEMAFYSIPVPRWESMVPLLP